MASRFEVTLALKGNLAQFQAAEERTLPQAVATVVRRAGTNAKNAVRREVRRAGLGGLANAVRSESKPPRGPSLDVTSRVFSKAFVKRAGGRHDLLEVFQTGAVIHARGSTFLAIPTELVGRTGKRRATPRDFANQLEPRIRRGADRGVLVFADGRGVAFVLVKTVTLKKRLPNLRAIAAKFGARIPEQIVTEWRRLRARAGARLLAA